MCESILGMDCPDKYGKKRSSYQVKKGTEMDERESVNITKGESHIWGKGDGWG